MYNEDMFLNPCRTPGMRIRSEGMGRGLARGMGYGPMGIPAGYRIYSPLGKHNLGKENNPLRDWRGISNPV